MGPYHASVGLVLDDEVLLLQRLFLGNTKSGVRQIQFNKTISRHLNILLVAVLKPLGRRRRLGDKEEGLDSDMANNTHNL